MTLRGYPGVDAPTLDFDDGLSLSGALPLPPLFNVCVIGAGLNDFPLSIGGPNLANVFAFLGMEPRD